MKTTKTTWCAVLTIGLACVTILTVGCGPVNVIVGGGGPVAGPSPMPPAGPALRMFHPVGGQTWHLGHNYTINWGAAPFVHRVRVYLSRNNGASWQYIGWAHAHPGTKVWHVPNMAAYLTHHARIRIVDMNNPANHSTSHMFRIVP